MTSPESATATRSMTTDRKNLIIQFNYARTYAVQTQNRELFVQLLEEVIAAGDVNRETRLLNKIARRRAQRYLTDINEFF